LSGELESSVFSATEVLRKKRSKIGWGVVPAFVKLIPTTTQLKQLFKHQTTSSASAIQILYIY